MGQEELAGSLQELPQPENGEGNKCQEDEGEKNMTCIVALKSNGKIYMGADSAGVGGLTLSIRADDKIFTNGPFIMGGTSSFRALQLLHWKFVPPKQTQKKDDVKYMCTAFIDAVRKCFKAGGYSTIDNNVETGGNFLIGYKGNIYEIDSDFQVGQPTDDYICCGCGGQVAKGSLFSSKGVANPQSRVKLALEAAEHFSAGVRGPFKYLEQ